jgi:hypothetical protein
LIASCVCDDATPVSFRFGGSMLVVWLSIGEGQLLTGVCEDKDEEPTGESWTLLRETLDDVGHWWSRAIGLSRRREMPFRRLSTVCTRE